MIVGSKERLAIEEKKMCVEQILEFLTPENDKGKKNNGRQSFSSKELYSAVQGGRINITERIAR